MLVDFFLISTQHTPFTATPVDPETYTPFDPETYTPFDPETYVVFGKTYQKMEHSRGYLEIGIASWYGTKFHGRLTSNGEIYDMYAISAAHKALPLPTFVKVTNLDNGKELELRVNDRGPFVGDRVIDLSYGAALELGFAEEGTAPVVVESLDWMNYPDDGLEEPVSSYYLQLGAFVEPAIAADLMENIKSLMTGEGKEHPIKVLQSKDSSGILLYKVWIGPILDVSRELELAVMIREADLGIPVKMEVN